MGWLDFDGQHYYYYDDKLRRFVCGVRETQWARGSAACVGTNDRGDHDHTGPCTPALVRLLRFNFTVRNFLALWGQIPDMEQFDVIARFYADRILDKSTPYCSPSEVPAWARNCARSGFPYALEAVKAHQSIRMMKKRQSPLSCVVELNSFCEYQRFGSLEGYTSVIPLDFEQARVEQVPDRTLPYIQRWSVPGKSLVPLLLLISHCLVP